MDLRAFFEAHPRVAIAFSGGVDSTYLVTAAAQYAQSVHAYTIDSVFVPRFELEGAKALTKKLGVAHTLLPIDVLQNETVVQNPKDRCYFCKKAVFFTIWEAAKKDGYDLLLDGTNASDDASDRPGMKALAELDVLSPLRLCGLTKTLIREKAEPWVFPPGTNLPMPALPHGSLQGNRSQKKNWNGPNGRRPTSWALAFPIFGSASLLAVPNCR